MAFTETRIKPLENTNAIEDALKEFEIIFQNQNNDFFSLAICGNACHSVLASGRKFFPEVNGFLVHLKKGELMLNIILLYRPNEMHPLLFCNNLENIVSTHEIGIILGDFNINFFNEADSLQLTGMMNRSNYCQIVKHATFVSSGSHLDHVYIKQSMLDEFKGINCETKSVYYSDHDSVQICVFNESV